MRTRRSELHSTTAAILGHAQKSRAIIPTLLASALVFALGSPSAQAGRVFPGQTAIVDASQTPEDWQIDGGGILQVLPGGRTLGIRVGPLGSTDLEGAEVKSDFAIGIVNGSADIRNSTITSGFG